MNSSTQFKKGQIPWNIGLKGYIKSNSGSFKKGQVPHNKGVKNPTGEIHAKNIVGQRFNRWTVMERSPFKDKHNYWLWLCICDCGTQRTVSTQLLRTGKSKSCGCTRKGNQKGDKNPFWKGGKTSIARLLRASVEYKYWRRHVFQRDDYTCQACGQRGGKIEADHELEFSNYPSLRFEILNGRTLCVDCHKKTPNYGRRVKSNEFSI